MLEAVYIASEVMRQGVVLRDPRCSIPMRRSALPSRAITIGHHVSQDSSNEGIEGNRDADADHPEDANASPIRNLYAWASISSDHGQSTNRLPELTKRKVEEKAMMDECSLLTSVSVNMTLPLTSSQT